MSVRLSAVCPSVCSLSVRLPVCCLSVCLLRACLSLCWLSLSLCCLSVYLSAVCQLPACLSVCLSVCLLSVRLSLCCLSVRMTNSIATNHNRDQTWYYVSRHRNPRSCISTITQFQCCSAQYALHCTCTLSTVTISQQTTAVQRPNYTK